MISSHTWFTWPTKITTHTNIGGKETFCASILNQTYIFRRGGENSISFVSGNAERHIGTPHRNIGPDYYVRPRRPGPHMINRSNVIIRLTYTCFSIA
eukprot:jgi/Botrbrau1/6414/Bobra.49_1s0030.1